MTTLNFIYKNAQNVVSARTVDVVHDDGNYLDGFCKTSAEYKTFRKDRIIEFVEDIHSDAVVEKVTAIQKTFQILEKKIGVKWTNRAGSPEVCFTGFKSVEKSELIKLAEVHGFFVRTSVSANLSFLICGPTAGPSKLKTAREQGVFLLNMESFKHLVETGEIITE